MYLKFNNRAFDTENVVTIGQYGEGQILILSAEHDNNSRNNFTDSRTIEQIYDALFNDTDFFIHKGVIYNPHTIGWMEFDSSSNSIDIANTIDPESDFSFSGFNGYGHGAHTMEDFDIILAQLNKYRSFIKIGNKAYDLENVITIGQFSNSRLRLHFMKENGSYDVVHETDIDLQTIKESLLPLHPCFIYKDVFYNADNIAGVKRDPGDNTIAIYGINAPEMMVVWAGDNGYGKALNESDFDKLIDLLNATKYESRAHVFKI